MAKIQTSVMEENRVAIAAGAVVGVMVLSVLLPVVYPVGGAPTTADYSFEKLPKNNIEWSVNDFGGYNFRDKSTDHTEGDYSYRVEVANDGTDYNGRVIIETTQTGIINDTSGFEVSFDFKYDTNGANANPWTRITLSDGNKDLHIQPLHYEGRWDRDQGDPNGITGEIVNNTGWDAYGSGFDSMTWNGWERIRIYSKNGYVYYDVAGFTFGRAPIEDSFDESQVTLSITYAQASGNYNPGSVYKTDNLNVGDYTPRYEVSGRVYDENNDPIQDAIVIANRSGSTIETVLTNSTGHYSMEIKNGTYTMEAWAENHTYVKKPGRVIDSDTNIDFLLVSSKNRLYGTVENETGVAIQGANVSVKLSDGTVIGSDQSASTGFYEVTDIENGTYEVTVTHPDYNDISTTIYFDDNVQRDFIMSKGGNKIDGWVKNNNGTGLGNSTIYVKNSSGLVKTVLPTSGGYYVATGLADGTYNITASHPDYKERTKQKTVTTDTTVNFTLSKINRSLYHVEGNITNASDGSAIDDAIVVVENASTVLNGDKTDPSGYYFVGGLANGSYTLRVAAAGYDQKTVGFTINGSNVTIDVNLTAGSNEVYGVVTNRSGPVEGATVEISLGGYVLGVDQTDSNGKYSIPGVGDGKYSMKASKQGHWPNKKQVQVSGDTKIDFEIYIPKLRIKVQRHYMKHGTKQKYEVFIDTGNQLINVTGDPDLTIYSENASVVSVNTGNHTLIATNDSDINKRVNIIGEYSGINDTATTYVTVANNSIAQLPVLPPITRITAVMGDSTIFALILMIWTAVVAARWTTSFGGLGAGSLASIIFWYSGYLSVGMMLLAVFVALFLGMNVATNIEYSVRQ